MRNNYYDPFFEGLSHMMARFDVAFRDIEKELGIEQPIFPIVTVPAIKKYYTDFKKYDDGEKVEYFLNGRLHNHNGPAIEYKDKNKESEYWLEGRKVTKEDVEKYKEDLEDKKEHYITIDGKTKVITGKQYKEFKSKFDDVKKIE